MPFSRTFVGGESAYVPDLGRWVEPGDVVEFDEDPSSPLFVTPAEVRKHHPEIEAAAAAPSTEKKD